MYNLTVSWSSGLSLDRGQNEDVWGEAGGSSRKIWMASTWPSAKAGPVTFLQTYSIHSSVLELQGLQSHLRRGFCWVISWARILPGNLGWWRTCGDFTSRGNVASFGYCGHDVCILSPCFPYYWMIGVLFFAPWKMVLNDRMWLSAAVCRHACVYSQSVDGDGAFPVVLHCFIWSDNEDCWHSSAASWWLATI